jgi:hypothetical protein
MPRRNLKDLTKTVEKFVTRFYPGTPESDIDPIRAKIDSWLRAKIAENGGQIPTRRLEALYAAENKGTPGIKPRRKLGENKKFWEYYVLKGTEIIDGPFVDRDRAVVLAEEKYPSAVVITATEAKRRGFLARYIPKDSDVPF